MQQIAALAGGILYSTKSTKEKETQLLNSLKFVQPKVPCNQIVFTEKDQ